MKKQPRKTFERSTLQFAVNLGHFFGVLPKLGPKLGVWLGAEPPPEPTNAPLLGHLSVGHWGKSRGGGLKTCVRFFSFEGG